MAHSRADVVAAALRVLDANGLEFTSMRRVAAALDVQPSALYHHVPNKQTLLALMADEIVRDVTLRGGDDAAALCHTLREALLAIRDGADVVATASAFRLGASAVEARLAELVGSDGARTLLIYTFGQAQITQTQLQAAELGALLPDTGAASHSGTPESASSPLERSRSRTAEAASATSTPLETGLGGLPQAADPRANLETELARRFADGVAIILRGLA